MQFYIKIKDVLYRSWNRLPRNILVSKNFKSHNDDPNWPYFQNVENACNKNWPTLGTILGLNIWKPMYF